MEQEIWKEYKTTRKATWEVSNYGNVKMNGKQYSCRINNCGYVVFGRNVFLHKAVAKLFIPNPEDKPEVDHIDTDKLNNHVDNLRWATRKENCNNPKTRQHISDNHHFKCQKRLDHSERMSGENNPSAKKCIFRDKEFGCVKDAQTYAKSIGVSRRNFRKELIIL